MSDINSITVTGRLTRDPELRQAGGRPVCRFGVACGRSWTNRDSGNLEERTTFFDCEVWGTRGERLAGILRQGMQVSVSGSHESETKQMQDGTRRTFWTLRVSELVLPPRGAQPGAQGACGAPQARQQPAQYDPGLQQAVDGYYAANPPQQLAAEAYGEEIPF